MALGDLVLGGMDTVGDMVLGRGGRRGARVPTPRWMNGTTSQGVSRPQEELDVLPLGAFTLNNQSESAQTNVAFQLTSNPQRPFRGERFVFTAVNGSGADVMDLINIIAPIFVGMVSVGAAFGQMPLRGFANNSFGVRMSVPAAGQGTILTISLVALTVPPVSTISVSGMLFGRAMR